MPKIEFIRHALGDQKFSEKLLADCQIGVHFDNKGADPDEYIGRSKRVMEKFKALGVEGATVMASFAEFSKSLFLVNIAPETPIVVQKNYLGSGVDLKTLAFTGCQEIKFSEAPALFGLMPQRGTLASSDLIARFFEKNGEVHSLSTSGLEVLCSEWLRDQGIVKYLTMPVGRTLRYVDIVGLDERGKEVFGQVTFHRYGGKDYDQKLKDLKEVGGERMFLFCDCPDQITDGAIQIVPIFSVFSAMKASHRILVEELLKPAKLLRERLDRSAV